MGLIGPAGWELFVDAVDCLCNLLSFAITFSSFPDADITPGNPFCLQLHFCRQNISVFAHLSDLSMFAILTRSSIYWSASIRSTSRIGSYPPSNQLTLIHQPNNQLSEMIYCDLATVLISQQAVQPSKNQLSWGERKYF